MNKFQLKEELDILLITFNRRHKLEFIVSDILSDNSPIKNCSITFLDNCSTDGTSEFLEELSKKHKNVKHIRHTMNIGGNANIVRALETVSKEKKYFWILCDDDRLDFTYWNNIQEALKSNRYDAIQVYSHPMVFSGKTYKEKLSKFIIEAAFVPGTIHKSENITDSVIFNAYINIHALFPHLSLVSSIINASKNIYFSDYNNNIVNQNQESDSEENRGKNRVNIHYQAKRIDWNTGFAISMYMINDKELVTECIKRASSFYGATFEGFIKQFAPNYIKMKYYDNILDIYDTCDDLQKKKLIEMIKYISKTDIKINDIKTKYIGIHLFTILLKKTFQYLILIGVGYIDSNEDSTLPKLSCLFGIYKNSKYLRINLFFILQITIKLKK